MTNSESRKAVDHRDWVEKRFNCSPEKVFGVLQDVIKADVAKYNQLSGKKYHCNMEWNVFQVFPERLQSSGASYGRSVTAKLEGSSVAVSKWNQDTLECELFIGEQKVTMHQASQKIIGPLLFGNG